MSAAWPALPARAGRQGGMLHCALETGDGETAAATHRLGGEGAPFSSVFGEDSLGFEYVLLKMDVWREKNSMFTEDRSDV